MTPPMLNTQHHRETNRYDTYRQELQNYPNSCTYLYLATMPTMLHTQHHRQQTTNPRYDTYGNPNVDNRNALLNYPNSLYAHLLGLISYSQATDSNDTGYEASLQNRYRYAFTHGHRRPYLCYLQGRRHMLSCSSTRITGRHQPTTLHARSATTITRRSC